MEIKGKKALVGSLAAMQQNVRAAVRAELSRSAQEINGFQRRLAPKDSGDLQLSIDYTFGEYAPDNSNVRGVSVGGGRLKDPDLTVVIHAGDKDAFYAKWIEFGLSGPWTIGGKFEGSIHPGFAAQPFFYPGWRMGAKRAKARLRSVISRTIKKSIGGKASSKSGARGKGAGKKRSGKKK